MESTDQTNPGTHENDQQKPLPDRSNSPCCQNRLGQFEPKSTRGSATRPQGLAADCDGVGSLRDDSREFQFHHNSLASADGVGGDDYGRSIDGGITAAIDGREIGPDPDLLPVQAGGNLSFEDVGIVKSTNQTNPMAHQNDQEKPLPDCPNLRGGKSKSGQFEPEFAAQPADNSESAAFHRNDMGDVRSGHGIGGNRDGLGQRGNPSVSVDSASRMADSSRGNGVDDRITAAIEEGERGIDPAILPMLIFYLAFHAKAGKRELSNYWISTGKTQEQVRQWFHEIHVKWRTFVVCSYGFAAAVFFIVRRILDDSSLASIVSLFGAVMLMMAIASAIYYYRPFNPVPDHADE